VVVGLRLRFDSPSVLVLTSLIGPLRSSRYKSYTRAKVCTRKINNYKSYGVERGRQKECKNRRCRCGVEVVIVVSNSAFAKAMEGRTDGGDGEW